MNVLNKLTLLRRIDFCRLIGSKINLSGAVAPKKTNPSSSNTNEMQCNRVVIEALSERELVRVEGEEVVPFLQGLITNDMNNLQVGSQHNLLSEPTSNTILSSMYTMFLNKTGRVLYDSIIYRDNNPNTYFIECDKIIAQELRRHLRLYRVRRKIKIDDVGQEYRPWIAFSPEDDTNVLIDKVRLERNINIANDPRVPGLGTRLITTANKTYTDLAEAFSKNGDVTVVTNAAKFNYRSHRYRYGIGEGVIDLPPGKCFPFEANCDFLHGVSFNKGCYIGQELTARVYHTGVIRKRIMPLRLTTPIPMGVSTVQTEAGKKVGTIRGTSGNRALALLRVEQVLNTPKLLIDGEPCYVDKPNWWPRELSTKASMSEGH